MHITHVGSLAHCGDHLPMPKNDRDTYSAALVEYITEYVTQCDSIEELQSEVGKLIDSGDTDSWAFVLAWAACCATKGRTYDPRAHLRLPSMAQMYAAAPELIHNIRQVKIEIDCDGIEWYESAGSWRKWIGLTPAEYRDALKEAAGIEGDA